MKLVVILVILGAGYFGYQKYKEKQAESELKAEVEYQVRDGFKRLGETSSSTKSIPKNAPKVITKSVCDNARPRCKQITRISSNAKVKKDAKFQEGLDWCTYVTAECKARGHD